MARSVRYDWQFRADLAERVRWLQRNRPPEQRKNLARAIASFKKRVAAFPGMGHEVALRGTVSYRARPLAESLPYLVWYSYDTARPDGSISLLMLLYESQDRERFDASRSEEEQ
ncbi:MAG: type II toxin-antitoxin system RelE/ParE family toxin [Candidatus Limnocylindria bacterium]